MRFLLFNAAVVAALFYLFIADQNGSDIGNAHREDSRQTIRQKLESLAQDFGVGREGVGQSAQRPAAAEVPKDVEAESSAGVADRVPGSPNDRPAPVASSLAETAPVDQDMGPAAAQASLTVEDGPVEGGAVADPNGPLPQVDDPAVAMRRAEVLDRVAASDDLPDETPVKGGPPMSAQERLRKLYSLAEEMELLYVNKMTR